MKKLLIITLLLCAIVLGWCSLQKWLSQDEIFEKKQECAKYRNELEKRNEQFNYSWNDQNWPYENSSIIDQIFYSPTQNSCLFTRLADFHYSSDKWGIKVDSWFIIEDALTHEQIWNSLPVNGDSYITYKNKFEEKIQEFKWE